DRLPRTRLTIGADPVALFWCCAADRIVGRAIRQEHPIEGIAQRAGPRAVGADEIALDDHATGRVQPDAVLVICRNHIALAGGSSANGMALTTNENAAATRGREPIRQRGQAAAIRPDEVALDDMIGTAQADAPKAVSRKHVSRSRLLASDGVGPGFEDEDPGQPVAEGRGAGEV